MKLLPLLIPFLLAAPTPQAQSPTGMVSMAVTGADGWCKVAGPVHDGVVTVSATRLPALIVGRPQEAGGFALEGRRILGLGFTGWWEGGKVRATIWPLVAKSPDTRDYHSTTTDPTISVSRLMVIDEVWTLPSGVLSSTAARAVRLRAGDPVAVCNALAGRKL